MNKLTIILILSLIFHSCSGPVPVCTGEQIVIDAKEAKTAFVEDITETIKYIPLKIPDSIIIGEISHIKSYRNYFFLHDEDQTKTITVFDTTGNFIAQLNKYGRGPGEYTNLFAFSFNLFKNKLTVYDRKAQLFIDYSFPGFENYDIQKVDIYFLNIELLDTAHWLVFSENDKKRGDEYLGAEILNAKLEVESTPTNIGNDVGSMEVSFPNTVSRINGKIYYAHPHEYTTIYQINAKEQKAEYCIDFGKNKIPLKYWKLTESSEFQESLVKGNPKATWVQNFIVNEKTLAFWFLFKDIDTRYLAVYDKESKTSQVYSRLRIKGAGVDLPAPKGVLNDNHISVIYPGEFDVLGITNKKLAKAFSGNKESLAPILAVYKF